MINVCYIAHSAEIGGAENNLLRIMQAGPALGVQSAPLIVPDEGRLASAARLNGIAVTTVRYHAFKPPNLMRHIETISHLRQAVVTNKVDVIHLNHHWLIEFAVRLGQVTRRPVVCHIRNLLNQADIEPFLHWFLRADAVIGVSRAVIAPLVAAGVPESRLHLVYDGLDFSQLVDSESSIDDPKLPGGNRSLRLVGVIGRVVPVKGIEEFLAASADVHRTFPDTHFLIIGADERDGQYIAELQQKAIDLGLGDSVSFTGFRTDIPQLLASLDLVVLPSRSDMPEGLPNTVLEALAMGRLVVATRNSGVPEVLVDRVNGFLVECDDVEGLVTAMEQALSLGHDERQAMEAAARDSVAGWTIENQVRQLAGIYRLLLKEGDGVPKGFS